jgi:hypothetical protein
MGLNQVKPECDLEEKRVAVVCLTNHSSYGSGSESKVISQSVSTILRKEVKKIELVPQSEIANWRDNNDWDEIDYRAVGRGVKADIVIAIDVKSLSFHEGQTLYKGKADVKVTAYDMTKGGDIAFSRDMSDFQYPQHGGRPVTDMSETKFQGMFLMILSEHIARNFHSWDPQVPIGEDARGLE